MASTRHDWLIELGRLSPAIAALNLTAIAADEPYWDTANNRAINADAFNLSGSPEHDAAISRWTERLQAQGVTPAQLTKFLIDLTGRNTYGAFAELAAYGLLAEADIPFEVQVPVTSRDILNPKRVRS